MELNLKKAIKDGVEQAFNEIELVIGMTLQEAIEKQTPKKAYCAYPVCPVCDSFVKEGKKYCSDCGQALEWKG